MPDWNTLFKEKENRWIDPYDDVIELTNSGLLPKDGLILDLGSGAGRHLRYLEKMRYRTVGMDIAWNGLTASKATLKDEKLTAQLIQADMSLPLPFAGNRFDSVISIHVIFHNPRAVIQRTISEMGRVLKPGGLIMVTFNAIYSSRCGNGEMLEENTWIPDAGVDKGIPHHFSTLSDAVDLMSAFKVLKIKLEENTSFGEVHSHWVVTALKP